MKSSYRQLSPRPELAHVVDAYWLNVSDAADCNPAGCNPPAVGPSETRVLPDGCIDLVLRAEPGRRQLFASALSTEPLSIEQPPGAWYVGVRFRPAMSRVVLDVPPAECRGGSIEAVAIESSFRVLERRLADVSSPAAALDLMRQEVEQRARAHAERAAPPRVRRALALISQPDGQLALSQVASALGVGERTLHRDIVSWAGLAPKVLARIFRMQRATAKIRGGDLSLAEVAFWAGYADQPHMTRELRRLTGRAPRDHSQPFHSPPCPSQPFHSQP